MHFYITPHDKLQHTAAATLIKILNLTKAGCTYISRRFVLITEKLQKKNETKKKLYEIQLMKCNQVGF